METKISNNTLSWRQLAAGAALCLVTACAQTAPAPMLASNPPPVPPGAGATWYHVEFATNSHTLDAQGDLTVANVTTALQQNPNAIVTIIGKTDTAGGADYNMHLSHLRADAVRDALVYHSNVAADRVETRWTGETREHVATGANVTMAQNRVVDIAIH
jgi:outer membrane protein OmpA-like peptidoglycan-associated protein